MISWRDIPILFAGWAVIFFVALVLDASSLVLHVVTYAVVAGAVSAHYIWEEIAEKGSFRLSRRRRRESRSASTDAD